MICALLTVIFALLGALGMLGSSFMDERQRAQRLGAELRVLRSMSAARPPELRDVPNGLSADEVSAMAEIEAAWRRLW